MSCIAMRKTFIPEVPESITRGQLIAATRALGLEPYTVHSITCNADEVTVELGMYVVEKPALDDRHAFRLGPAHQFGATTTATIRVRDTPNGDER